MMRRTTVTMILAALAVTLVALPAGAQPTELEERSPVELGPSGDGSVTDLAVVVRRGEFTRHWLEIQRSVVRNNGTVVSATAETTEVDGERVAFGVAELRVPPGGYSAVLSDILSIGTVTSGSVESSNSGIAEITVTLSESAQVPATGSGSGASRLGRALDTAADVVLTIVSVVIVVAAAIIPTALVVLVGYAVWRLVRRRLDPPVQVTRVEDTRTSELVDS